MDDVTRRNACARSLPAVYTGSAHLWHPNERFHRDDGRTEPRQTGNTRHRANGRAIARTRPQRESRNQRSDRVARSGAPDASLFDRLDTRACLTPRRSVAASYHNRGPRAQRAGRFQSPRRRQQRLVRWPERRLAPSPNWLPHRIAQSLGPRVSNSSSAAGEEWFAVNGLCELALDDSDSLIEHAKIVTGTNSLDQRRLSPANTYSPHCSPDYRPRQGYTGTRGESPTRRGGSPTNALLKVRQAVGLSSPKRRRSNLNSLDFDSDRLLWCVGRDDQHINVTRWTPPCTVRQGAPRQDCRVVRGVRRQANELAPTRVCHDSVNELGFGDIGD